jgi:PadR family transcriptional regulator PadR
LTEPVANSDLVRGSIDTIILSVLLERDNYGYQIIKEIYLKSGREFELKEPTLYAALRRLEAQGALESYWGEESQGGRRKYYRVTEAGKVLYRKNYDAWQAVKKLIDRLLERREEA